MRPGDDLYLIGHVWRDGRPSMVASDGRVRPVIMGGDGEGPPPPPAGTAPPAPGSPGSPGVPGQQAQPDLAGLQRLVDESKTSGASEATRAALDALGFADLDAAKAFVESARSAEAATLTEVERRERAAEEREQRAQQAESAAAQTVHDATVERALLTAGVALPEDAAEASALLASMRRLVDAPVGADAEAVAAAVAKVKGTFPEKFGLAPPGGAPHSVPNGRPPTQQATKSALDAGRERARQVNERRNPTKTEAKAS